MEEGKAVHAAARNYVLSRFEDPRFECGFTSPEGLRARLDALCSDGSEIDLIEIKASTRPEEHIRDVAFQKVAVERSGVRVRKCIVIHLDPTFRSGADRPALSVFTERDITAEVEKVLRSTANEIDAILDLLKLNRIDEHGCECRYKGSVARRCSAFAHLNPDIEEPSIHLLPNISASRLRRLDDQGRLDMSKVTEDDVTPAQLLHLQAFRSGKAVIDLGALASQLETLEWPVHFYDYETHARAMPTATGHGPHMHVPVQFSLHVLHRSGELEHHEHLSKGEGREAALVEDLARSVGAAGSLLAWNMSFEKGRNRVLAELVPTHANFLLHLNERTRDLMLPFKTAYVDPGFGGSASIKKVLPVICPHLAYDEEAVHDGAGAMQAWREMITSSDAARRSELDRQLRAYCRLDTLAMVEIYRHLEQIVGRN